MEHQIVIEVGQTRYSQRVELIKEKDGFYTIIQHACNQRDETQRISGLDAQTIKNMIKAVDLKLR